MKVARIILIIGVGLIVIISITVLNLVEIEKSSFELDVCGEEPNCFSAKVTNVIDGDTIDLKHLSTGEPIRIRLSLVDTHEKNEPLYVAGKEFTSNLCPTGSIVIVDQDDGQLSDRFGRFLGIVYCDGILLNKQLLEAELAVVDYRFCDDSEYRNEDWSGC